MRPRPRLGRRKIHHKGQDNNSRPTFTPFARLPRLVPVGVGGGRVGRDLGSRSLSSWLCRLVDDTYVINLPIRSPVVSHVVECLRADADDRCLGLRDQRKSSKTSASCHGFFSAMDHDTAGTGCKSGRGGSQRGQAPLLKETRTSTRRSRGLWCGLSLRRSSVAYASIPSRTVTHCFLRCSGWQLRARAVLWLSR